MKRALIVVDMQNDFIDGSLGTPEAQAIVPAVKAKLQSCRERGDEIIFTRDTHGEDYLSTPEGKKLPVVHCVQGTHGWELAPVDICFPVLHGKHGEDGTIQGLFQLAGIPFVGCDAISSANCMDKEMTHTILEAHGIQMAKWLRVDNEKMQDFDAFAKQAEQKLGYPMFVKPANAGSSVGVGKAHDRAELKSACLHALQEDYKAVVEECIEMQEMETAVLGNSNPQAAGVVGELVPVVEFYTYEAKYIDGTTALHIPGRVDEEISQQLRRTAEKAFAAIGCQGFARIDFFVRKGDHAVILNEINTIPGFTSISMYPKLWAHCGLSYPQLLDRLIQLGLERNAQ